MVISVFGLRFQDLKELFEQIAVPRQNAGVTSAADKEKTFSFPSFTPKDKDMGMYLRIVSIVIGTPMWPPIYLHNNLD